MAVFEDYIIEPCIIRLSVFGTQRISLICTRFCCSLFCYAGLILEMGSADERRRYIVTSAVFGLVLKHNAYIVVHVKLLWFMYPYSVVRVTTPLPVKQPCIWWVKQSLL